MAIAHSTSTDYNHWHEQDVYEKSAGDARSRYNYAGMESEVMFSH
jgi:hypothetical protein